MNISLISKTKVFNGFLERYKHYSEYNKCYMNFSIYIPNKNSKERMSALYWLSGLTCTDENFCIKSGAFSYADKYKIIIIIADTSPRGENVPDDENYDLGQGASFYLNATKEPWVTNYQMYDYIKIELPKIIEDNFPISTKKSIFGHSMGGHGALMIALKNAENYQSVSAFAPITNLTSIPWGQKACLNYLGSNKETWMEYDSYYSLENASRKIPILIYQGDKDEFYPDNLQPENFVLKAKELNFPVEFKLLEGYDHSYYFITTFIEDHFNFHIKYLK